MGTKTVVMIPWATPPIISGYLVTGGHISGAILQLFNFVIAMVIYYPFVVLCDRSVVRTEKQQHKVIVILYLCNIVIVLTGNSVCENNYLYHVQKMKNIYMNTKLSLINSYFNRHVQTEGVFKSVEPYREGGNYDDYSRTNSIPIDFK